MWCNDYVASQGVVLVGDYKTQSLAGVYMGLPCAWQGYYMQSNT